MLINDAINFHGLYRTPASEFNGKIEHKNFDYNTKDTKNTSDMNKKIKLG